MVSIYISLVANDVEHLFVCLFVVVQHLDFVHVLLTFYLIILFSLLMKVKALVAQLCLTLCDPMDCSPPGSSVHGILQARILAWVAISFSSLMVDVY